MGMAETRCIRIVTCDPTGDVTESIVLMTTNVHWWIASAHSGSVASARMLPSRIAPSTRTVMHT